MTKANWKEAPHDAETYEQFGATSLKYCKPGYCWEANAWVPKPAGNWTILEHRPRIIAWEDMKEGMVVRCLHSEGSYNYKAGKCYPVGVDEYGDLGPLDDDGHAPPSHYLGRYTFELVSEPEQRKTVKDAVEHYSGEWPGACVVCHDQVMGWRDWSSDWEPCFNFYQVCTREEFEAEVKRLDPNSWDVLIDSPEGEDEEWTHTYNEENCYIKYNEPDRHGYVIIVLESEGYDVALPENLKPIKPTITKDQFELLEKARQYFDIDPKDFAKFMNDYEVK